MIWYKYILNDYNIIVKLYIIVISTYLRFVTEMKYAPSIVAGSNNIALSIYKHRPDLDQFIDQIT